MDEGCDRVFDRLSSVIPEGAGRFFGSPCALFLLLPLAGCFGLRLSVAPTVDTGRNVGVEARLSGEIDALVVHVGVGGGGGRVAGEAAGAWHAVLGGSIPFANSADDLVNWLDVELFYSGYKVAALAERPSPESPFVHGVRLQTAYRRRLINLRSLDASLSMGVGVFGEAAFFESSRIGVFGLPLVFHMLVFPKVKFF